MNSIPRDVLLSMRDPSYPLLKSLRQKAPGTYFHCVLVAELAAHASLLFPHSDPLLAHIGGLFHDIGKMVEPDAYAENQEDRSYPFKPEVIITHVEKSLELAEAFQIPEKIQRFMSTHHGTQNAPQVDVDQKNPYPSSSLPQTIEETLVMLADSCEAAVRSLKKTGRSEIRELIKRIFAFKLKQGQLRESVLLPADLVDIQESFTDVFTALYHRRFATEK